MRPGERLRLELIVDLVQLERIDTGYKPALVGDDAVAGPSRIT